MRAVRIGTFPFGLGSDFRNIPCLTALPGQAACDETHGRRISLPAALRSESEVCLDQDSPAPSWLRLPEYSIFDEKSSPQGRWGALSAIVLTLSLAAQCENSASICLMQERPAAPCGAIS